MPQRKNAYYYYYYAPKAKYAWNEEVYDRNSAIPPTGSINGAGGSGSNTGASDNNDNTVMDHSSAAPATRTGETGDDANHHRHPTQEGVNTGAENTNQATDSTSKQGQP